MEGQTSSALTGICETPTPEMIAAEKEQVEQYLRRDCLRMALQLNAHTSPEPLVKVADAFYNYIKTGK